MALPLDSFPSPLADRFLTVGVTLFLALIDGLVERGRRESYTVTVDGPVLPEFGKLVLGIAGRP